MNILFYKNTSDNKVVNKNISKILEYDGIIGKDNIDILNPQFSILLNDENIKILESNYLYIPNFKRYYYINTELKGNLIIVNCEVDVLYTYRNYIKSLECNVDRNENVRNGYLYDNQYLTYSYDNITLKMFPQGFNNNSIILMTV